MANKKLLQGIANEKEILNKFQETNATFYMNIDDIKPYPYNHLIYDDTKERESDTELRVSLLRNGYIEIFFVGELPNKERYLISGHRTLKTAKEIRKTEPEKFKDKNLGQAKVTIIKVESWAEMSRLVRAKNIKREFNIMDMVGEFEDVIRTYKIDGRDIETEFKTQKDFIQFMSNELLGKSEATIRRLYAITKLPTSIKQLISQGKITGSAWEKSISFTDEDYKKLEKAILDKIATLPKSEILGKAQIDTICALVKEAGISEAKKEARSKRKKQKQSKEENEQKNANNGIDIQSTKSTPHQGRTANVVELQQQPNTIINNICNQVEADVESGNITYVEATEILNTLYSRYVSLQGALEKISEN